MKSLNVIKSQSHFCLDLMLRLDKEIQIADRGDVSAMELHSRKQKDIMRIRRELLELSKMLGEW